MKTETVIWLLFFVHKQTCIVSCSLNPTTDPQLKMQSFMNFLTIYSNFCSKEIRSLKKHRESLGIVISKLFVGFSEQYGRIFDELLSSLSIKTGNNYCAMI